MASAPDNSISLRQKSGPSACHRYNPVRDYTKGVTTNAQDLPAILQEDCFAHVEIT